MSDDVIPPFAVREVMRAAIAGFAKRVFERAEASMSSGEPLEGAHYRAILAQVAVEIPKVDIQSTHFEQCWHNHLDCARMAVVDYHAALAALLEADVAHQRAKGNDFEVWQRLRAAERRARAVMRRYMP